MDDVLVTKELMILVFNMISYWELSKFMLVSRFYGMIINQHYWKERMQNDFPEITLTENYQRLYFQCQFCRNELEIEPDEYIECITSTNYGRITYDLDELLVSLLEGDDSTCIFTVLPHHF